MLQLSSPEQGNPSVRLCIAHGGAEIQKGIGRTVQNVPSPYYMMVLEKAAWHVQIAPYVRQRRCCVESRGILRLCIMSTNCRFWCRADFYARLQRACRGCPEFWSISCERMRDTGPLTAGCINSLVARANGLQCTFHTSAQPSCRAGRASSTCPAFSEHLAC